MGKVSRTFAEGKIGPFAEGHEGIRELRTDQKIHDHADRPSTLLKMLLSAWMKSNYGFSRRGPDRVAEELAKVLLAKQSFEFKPLFTLVHANLKSRNAASGGEEMLRLRAYEKLQNLVEAGMVKKTGKEYRGVPAGLASFMATAAELNAEFEARKLSREPAIVKK